MSGKTSCIDCHGPAHPPAAAGKIERERRDERSTGGGARVSSDCRWARRFSGVLLCLPLCDRKRPGRFVIFMFLSQPLLGAAFLLFAWQVFRDLRNKELL